MPTYEYACRDCGEHLEVVQSFRDDPLTECPACAGTLRKVFSPVGIAFKGSGFYKTDSRSSTGAAKRESTGAATEGSGTAASTSSSDSSGSATTGSSGSSSGSSGSSASSSSTAAAS